MMRILEPRHVVEIERALGRATVPEDFEGAASIAELSSVAKANALLIARRSRPLAVMYVNELIPGVSVSEAVRFLDE